MLFCLCIFLALSLSAQDAAEEYVSTYAPIAISEMQRTGIPASIKLAQAVLESNSGRSEMAKVAKNHFGIKCGNSWEGMVYYREDDDKDHRGRLIESCFRSYNDVTESFIAHSEFLRNRGKTSRYEFLFDYKSNDYKRWARGLSKAGYATDPRYPQKLIHIIEKYELYRYDDMDPTDRDHIVFESANEEKPTVLKTSGGRILNDESTYQSKRDLEIPDYKMYNDVKMILATGNETLNDLAQHYNVDLAALLTYNENVYEPHKIIPAKSRVYLEHKKLAFKGKKKFHQLRQGEKMKHVAQNYAVDLEALYIRNRMPFGSEAAPGERIQLKGLIRSGKRPRIRSKGKSGIVEKSRFVEETVEYIFSPKNGDKD